MTSKGTKGMLKIRFRGAFIPLGASFLLMLLLKNPTLAGEGVKSALSICAEKLIPSLFPLMVAGEIATESRAIERLTKPISKISSRIFGISERATVPYFIGILCGYAASSRSALLLYRSGSISKDECETAIALSSVPSLAFFTGYVGLELYNNSTIGWILWGVSLFSTLALGFLNKIFFSKRKKIRYHKDDHSFFSEGSQKKDAPQDQKSLPRLFSSAIGNSAYSMLLICASVVFFSVLQGALSSAFESFGVDGPVKALSLGSLEITGALSICQDVKSPLLSIALASLFIGWSGFSVHFQVISLTEEAGISFKKYFIFKAFQAFICLFLSLLILQ